MDKTRHEGKKALITGDSQEMGAAIAQYWAAQGAVVCVAAVKVEGIEKDAEEIKADGGEAIFIKLDVTDEDQAVAAVEHTAKTFGEINLLLNNAGANKPLLFPDITKPNYELIVGVNALGKTERDAEGDPKTFLASVSANLRAEYCMFLTTLLLTSSVSCSWAK